MSEPEDVTDDQRDDPVADDGFVRLLEKLSTEYNFDSRDDERASLARRIRVRMQQVRAESFDSAAHRLRVP